MQTHCPSEISHLHLRERMLLARAQGLPICDQAEDEHGVLEHEDREQPRTRPEEFSIPRITWLARNRRLGVRAEEGQD